MKIYIFEEEYMTRGQILTYLQTPPTGNLGKVLEVIFTRNPNEPVYGKFRCIGANIEGRATCIGLEGGEYLNLDDVASVQFLVPEKR